MEPQFYSWARPCPVRRSDSDSPGIEAVLSSADTNVLRSISDHRIRNRPDSSWCGAFRPPASLMRDPGWTWGALGPSPVPSGRPCRFIYVSHHVEARIKSQSGMWRNRPLMTTFATITFSHVINGTFEWTGLNLILKIILKLFFKR